MAWSPNRSCVNCARWKLHSRYPLSRAYESAERVTLAEEIFMEDKRTAESPVCFNCGNTSEQSALFRVLIKNIEQWVCARCLPVLIHGPH